MQHLQLISLTPEIALYEIQGNNKDGLKPYVISTQETRDICNKPEITGIAYTSRLRTAVTHVLKNFPEKEVFAVPDNSVCELVFLRGGLNFGIKEALHSAFDFNNHCTSFISSQRYKVAENTWGITENMYRKIIMPDNGTLVCGDIVATGVTLYAGLDVIIREYIDAKKNMKDIVFFTIGGENTEKIFAQKIPQLKKEFKDFRNVHILYLEGRFAVVDEKTNLRIGIPGTDLIRKDCLLTPEFELSQYEQLSHVLERCTIYDGGTRSFDVKEYKQDVLKYWNAVLKLAENGFTLYDALKERFPEIGYETLDSLRAQKGEQWKGIDDSILQKLHAAYNTRWTPEFIQFSQTTVALQQVCQEKINQIIK